MTLGSSSNSWRYSPLSPLSIMLMMPWDSVAMASPGLVNRQVLKGQIPTLAALHTELAHQTSLEKPAHGAGLVVGIFSRGIVPVIMWKPAAHLTSLTDSQVD